MSIFVTDGAKPGAKKHIFLLFSLDVDIDYKHKISGALMKKCHWSVVLRDRNFGHGSESQKLCLQMRVFKTNFLYESIFQMVR